MIRLDAYRENRRVERKAWSRVSKKVRTQVYDRLAYSTASPEIRRVVWGASERTITLTHRLPVVEAVELQADRHYGGSPVNTP